MVWTSHISSCANRCISGFTMWMGLHPKNAEVGVDDINAPHQEQKDWSMMTCAQITFE